MGNLVERFRKIQKYAVGLRRVIQYNVQFMCERCQLGLAGVCFSETMCARVKNELDSRNFTRFENKMCSNILHGILVSDIGR